MPTILKTIDAVDLKRGDEIVVVPGNGKHRGNPSDDGVLEVCGTLIGFDGVYISALDSELGSWRRRVPFDDKISVIRHV